MTTTRCAAGGRRYFGLATSFALTAFAVPVPVAAQQQLPDTKVTEHHPIQTDWPPSTLANQVVDVGLPGYRQFVDVDGDGNLDYCRFVGNSPNQFLSCQMGTAPGYLSKQPYGFNSPPGAEMGEGPYGMIGGTSEFGPRYCRNVKTNQKAAIKHGLATTMELRCIVGLAVKGKTPKFYANDIAACPTNSDVAVLLSEPDQKRDPYLVCQNSKAASWSVTRTDPNGITWQLATYSGYDNIAKTTTTDTIIRQLTRNWASLIQPNRKDSHSEYPIKYASHFSVLPDGSTKTIIMSSPMIDSSIGVDDSLLNSLTYIIKPQGGEFTVSASRSQCYPLNSPGNGGTCSTIASFTGLTLSNAITWQGTSPKWMDLRPGPIDFPGLFSAVKALQGTTFSNTIFKSAPDLVNKIPSAWNSSDIQRIVNILTVSTGGGTATAQQQGSVASALYTIKTLGLVVGAYIGHAAADAAGEVSLGTLSGLSDAELDTLAEASGMTPLGWAAMLTVELSVFGSTEYLSYKIEKAGEDQAIQDAQQAFDTCIKQPGTKLSDCDNVKQTILNTH